MRTFLIVVVILITLPVSWPIIGMVMLLGLMDKLTEEPEPKKK
jgi:hypothetical protein